MIKYCCDKCGEEIKEYDGDNDRMVLNYYIEKTMDIKVGIELFYVMNVQIN